MEDSTFTKIIKGELPCHKIYEDEKTLAFMDINPAQPGHVVVVPKLQESFIWELDDENYQALMNTVHKVGKRLQEAFPEKARIGVFVEGFGVDSHAHVNVIPCNTPKELRNIPSHTNQPDHEALAEMAKKLAF